MSETAAQARSLASMTEGERAGRWAIAYLLIVGVAAYFTIFMVIFSFLKHWLN